MSEDKAVKWLRRKIEERLFLARHAVELGACPEWTEQSSGVLVTGEPPAGSADIWFGTWAMGDSSLTRLMEANDPRDTIARCEAELGILDLHAATLAITQKPPVMPEGHPAAGMISARDYLDAKRELAVLEPVVRLLASGYRHRPGYEAAWGQQDAKR